MTRSRYMVGLVFLVFFVMSLVTNILGPIIPDIIRDFHVSLAAAAFLGFFFFIAYGVMSIPAGFLVERYSEKPVMITAFLAASIGSLSFALFLSYSVALGSLFVMGAGMATLQVAVNPLLRVSGGEEHFAFNSAFAQLIFWGSVIHQPQDLFLFGGKSRRRFPSGQFSTPRARPSYSQGASVGFDVLDLCSLHPAHDRSPD